MINISYQRLLNFTYKIFRKVRLNEFSARTVSFGICEASLRGVDSHGIKLFPHYVKSSIFQNSVGIPENSRAAPPHSLKIPPSQSSNLIISYYHLKYSLE